MAALGLRPEAARRLTTYLDLLAAWNERINLTGLNTSADRVRVLVEAILPARDLPAPGTLLDLGSGNGSPGLVLAATRDDLDVTLLEPRAKRWAFLREAVRQMGLAVSVLRERHDSYGGRPARTVTLRALALPIAQLRPLVEPGGQILVFGRPPREANGVAMQPLMGSDGRVVCHSLRVPRETSVAAVADPEPT